MAVYLIQCVSNKPNGSKGGAPCYISKADYGIGFAWTVSNAMKFSLKKDAEKYAKALDGLKLPDGCTLHAPFTIVTMNI